MFSACTKSFRWLVLFVLLVTTNTLLVSGDSKVIKENDLLDAVKNHTPDPVIIAAIKRANLIVVDLGLKNLGKLSKKGVSQAVIEALQQRDAELNKGANKSNE